MNNKLASAVTAYTPQHPVSQEVADEIEAAAAAALQDLASEVDKILQQVEIPESLQGDEREVIIITSPPVPP